MSTENFGEAALRSVAKGNADEGRQQRALDHIINDICRYYSVNYDDKDVRFYEGRRSVAHEIIDIIRRTNND